MDKKKIVVIGAGVIGSAISRELCRYDFDVTLLEKNTEAGMGVTKANSAIVHGGYDDDPQSVRARFCAAGNDMFEGYCTELGVDFKRIGSYVLAFAESEMPYLKELQKKAIVNGIKGCEIHDAATILRREENISDEVCGGFWCPTAGITEPWMLAIASVENAVANGLKVRYEENAIDIKKSEKNGVLSVDGVLTDKNFYEADVVINCAGLYADTIVEMAGTQNIDLHPRKGEYILLDKKLGNLVNTIIFPVPDKKSKGILVVPTIDGGLLIGPTAEDLDRERREETSTTQNGLNQVVEKTMSMVKKIDLSLTVKTFAGLRPETPQKDFVIGLTALKGFINAAAMRSPGLTSAPAISKYISQVLVPESIGENCREKAGFNPVRKKDVRPATLPAEDWEKLVKEDDRYGNIVCLCNKITEMEIIEAVKKGARTVDSVKFRTRASFGRCQGGFCLPKIVEIISRETGLEPEKIRLSENGSEILIGKVRI